MEFLKTYYYKILWFISWLIERPLSFFGQGDIVKDIRTVLQQRERNHVLFNEIFSFYYPKIKDGFIALSCNDNNNRPQAYHYWVEHQPNFRNVSPNQKNIFVLLALCHEFEHTRDPETNIAIKFYLDTFSISFQEISDDAENLLNVYEKVFISTKSYTLEELLQTQSQDYLGLLRNFSRRFSKDLLAFQFAIDKLNQSEDLRYTLLKIIKDGKLETFGLNQQTLRKLENDLRGKTDYTKNYLIIANHLPVSIESYIKMQSGFGGVLHARNIPWFKGSHTFSAYVIRPNERFSSTQEYFKNYQNYLRDFQMMRSLQFFPLMESMQNKF